MAHLYTYNTFAGLSAGIPMTIGASMPSNPSRKAPPHLPIGLAGFIGLNTRWSNVQFVSGRLLRSSLTKIEPAGKKRFYVFDAPRQNDEHHSLILIDTSVPKNMTRRPESDVNAWTGIRGEGFEKIMFDRTTSTALLRCEPNASIELFQFDGSVHLLRVENGKVSTVPLNQKQMATLRGEQFEEQIATLDLSLERDMKRLHGILAGAMRLISAAKETAALDVLVDFLTDHQAELTDHLRKQVRWALSDAGHPAANTFLDGFEAGNVVKIQSADAASARAKAEQRRRERSEMDRRRTNDAKARARQSEGEGDITKQSQGRGGSKADGKKK